MSSVRGQGSLRVVIVSGTESETLVDESCSLSVVQQYFPGFKN